MRDAAPTRGRPDLDQVPRALRPVVWLFAVVLTPAYLAGEALGRLGAAVGAAVARWWAWVRRALRAVGRLLRRPVLLLARGLAALARALAVPLNALLDRLLVLGRGCSPCWPGSPGRSACRSGRSDGC